MTRLLAVLLASFMSVAVAVPAMAKKVKPPKDICWVYSGGTRAIVIGFKKTSSIRLLDGKTSFYSAQGVQNYDGTWFPASGSAFVRTPADQEMTVHLTSVAPILYSFEISWYLDIRSGNVRVDIPGVGTVIYGDLTAIDCEGLDPTS
jgi:hypothetical protein